MRTTPIPWCSAVLLGCQFAAAQTNTDIPWKEIGAVAGKQYSGDGLSVTATAEGARLRCVFQHMDGQATREGLWLVSTTDPAKGERFRVTAQAVGRDRTSNIQHPTSNIQLADTGRVAVDGKTARFSRPGLVEEYSVSMEGVRQDFVIAVKPAGPGQLRVELAVDGARAEASPQGARLVLADSGREIAYTRLRATDATGRELPAWMEDCSAAAEVTRLQSTTAAGRQKAERSQSLLKSAATGATLAVLVNDADAVYPVRIDPTFSDANWGGFGFPAGGLDGDVLAVAVDDIGNIYVGGDFVNATNQIPQTVHVQVNYVAKWDGYGWSALGSGLNGSVAALAVWGNNLYAGGLFTTAGGTPANYIAVWNGNAWSALAGGVNSHVSALAVAPNGDLYAGGFFTTATNVGGLSVPANCIARWSGGAWSALNGGVNDAVFALAFQGSDLYVGGYFTSADGKAANHIAKWNSAWSSLGTGANNGVNDVVQALAPSYDGNGMYAGGSFTAAGGSAANYIAYWNSGTGAWSSLGSGGANGVNASVMALATSGSYLYIGGVFTSAGGSALGHLAVWDELISSWEAPANGTTQMNDAVYALAVASYLQVAGGAFTSAGGNPASRVAIGPTWSGLGPGVIGGFARAMAILGNDVYVGGGFLGTGGTRVNNIARWDGYRWSALGLGVNGQVNALAVSGTNLYVGGCFTTATNTGAGAITVNSVAKWDGTSWTSLGAGIPSYYGSVYCLAVSGSAVYAGTDEGTFQWDGTTWSWLGTGGVDSGIATVAASGSNLYVGGDSGIAEWDGTAWSRLDSNLISADVYSLAASGSNVYAGGFFEGANAWDVMKWDGITWSPVGQGLNDIPYALVVSGNDVYAGGSSISRWNGSSWEAMLSSVGGSVNALALSGSNLYAGGYFTMAGGKPAFSVAEATFAPVQVLADWNVSGVTSFGLSPLAPTTTAPNLAVVGLTRGPGVKTTSTAAARGWGGNEFVTGTEADAITAGDYVTFSFMPNPGYAVSFTAINKFDYRRSSTGPTNGVVQYQVGSGPFTDITNLSYASSSSSGSSIAPIDLAGIPALQKLPPGTTVTFRIVSFGGTSATGTWYIFDTGNSPEVDFSVIGSVGSATLYPPEIQSQPASQSQLIGTSTGFNVSAVGLQTLSYQWQLNSTNLPGATTANLTIPNLGLSDAGDYRVIVTNLVGSVTSSVATLTVLAPPSITQQPQNASAQCGTGTATFSVTPSGTPPFGYQWCFNGTPIPGATATSYTVSPAALATAGDYTVVVTNLYDAVTSSNATLTLTNQTPTVANADALSAFLNLALGVSPALLTSNDIAGTCNGLNTNLTVIAVSPTSSSGGTVQPAGVGTPVWTNRYSGPVGAGNDARAVAVDLDGGVIVTGGSFNGSNKDSYTAKYAATNGALVWEYRDNGAANRDVETRAVAVGLYGDVAIAGYASNGSNKDFFTDDVFGGWPDVVNGPGNSDDEARAIAVDGNGNVVVAGDLQTSPGVSEYYIAEYDYYNSGVGRLWSQTYRGPFDNDSLAQGVAVDRANNVYVTGYSGTNSQQFGFLHEYVTIAYSSAGAPLWTNHFGGLNPRSAFDNQASSIASPAFDNQASGIALDANGKVFVTGISGGIPMYGPQVTGGLKAGMVPNATITQPPMPSNYDYLTVAYSTNGTELWYSFYDGPGHAHDYAVAVAAGPDGGVYVTGYSAANNTTPYNYDYATIKYSNTGVPLWTNRYNGPGNGDDHATGLAVDGSGNVYVTGYSTGTNGHYDYATVAYSSAGAPLWTNRYNNLANKDNLALAVAADSGANVYVTGSSDDHAAYATIKYATATNILYTPPPNFTGTDTFTYVVQDSLGMMATGTVTVTVYGPPEITVQPQDQTVPAGSNVTFSVTATGGPSVAYQWRHSGTNLPGATATTLAIPTARVAQAGAYDVIVANPALSVTSSVVTLTVTCPSIVLDPPSLPDLVLAATSSPPEIVPSGGTAPYSFSVSSGSLPSGLYLATDSRGYYGNYASLSGIPSALGTSIYTITATDTNGCTGSQTYTQSVVCPQIVLSPTNLPVGLVGSNYNQAITATAQGSELSLFSYSVTQGSLPPGLTLAAGGTLSGTPTAGGLLNFTVTAAYGSYCAGSNAYTLNVTSQTPTVANADAVSTFKNAALTISMALLASNDVAGSFNGLNTNLTLISVSPASAGSVQLLAPGTPLWTNCYDGPGNSGGEARAVAVDGSGNVFVTGYSYGSGMDTIAYSSAGVPLWTNRHSGEGRALAVDASGNLVVTGYYYGGNAVNLDYATIAYNSAGTALWTNYYNGPDYDSDDEALAVALDGRGNAYVTGNVGVDEDEHYATISYNSAGLALWTNRYDGGLGDEATAMAVDGSGNVFVTGSSYSMGSYPYPSELDYATIAYNSAGLALWTNRYNGLGSGSSVANAVAVDGRGNVFVTGYSEDGGGNSSVYATIAYSNAGVPLWTNRYSGPWNYYHDEARAVAVDGRGNVFVTGYSWDEGSSPTIAYSSAGVPLWTNRYNGPYEARALAVDGSGNVFVTGMSLGGYATIKYSGPTNLRYTPPTDFTGTDTFTYVVQDSLGMMATGTVTVTVYSPLEITVQPQSQTNLAGTTATFNVVATGALPLAYQWRKNGFPMVDDYNVFGTSTPTLTLTSVSAASAVSEGDYDVVVTNLAGSVTSVVATLTVTCPQIDLTSSLLDGVLHQPYSAMLNASGGVQSYLFMITSGTPAPGLNLIPGSTNTAFLSGTPNAGGTFVFTVTASDTYGCSGSLTLTQTVVCPSIWLLPPSLPNAILNSSYNQTITASESGGSPFPTFTYALAGGSLPGGLTLSPSGNLSGTPTAAGVFNFSVSATEDFSGCVGANAYTLTVVGPPSISQPPRIVNGNFVVHFAGVSYANYSIEVRTNLRGSWGNPTYVTASPAGDIAFSTPISTAPMSFFRSVPVP